MGGAVAHMNRATTHLIEYQPYRLRNECCAIGFLVLNPDGQIRVHLASNLRKVKAIHPSTNSNELRETLEKLAEDLTKEPVLLQQYLSNTIGGISINPRKGYITYSNQEEYESAMRWALGYMVEPAPSRAIRERPPTSRLYLEMRNLFADLGWLASATQGINDHRILPRYQLSTDEGLSVDFALLNSAMHYLQTADFRITSNVTQRRNEVQAKWFALALAPQLTPLSIAEKKIENYAVIAGAYTEEGAKAIKAASRISNCFVHESNQDMQELMDIYAKAMGQEPLPALTTH